MAHVSNTVFKHGVATFVVTRQDGHTLSYSSHDSSLVHFNGNRIVKDFGFVNDAGNYAAKLRTFLAKEIR